MALPFRRATRNFPASSPRMDTALGMSEVTSWLWRLRVAVETTTGVSFVQAHMTDGSRYARDLPTPVPASIMRCSLSLNARTTALSMSICPGRSS